MTEIHSTGNDGGGVVQLTLDGLELREIGTSQALRAVPEWAGRAVEAAMLLLRKGHVITSEDVTDLVGTPTTRNGVNRNNAVGAVFRILSNRGLIRRVGWTQARNPQSHARLIPRWTLREDAK